jgi:uncharacterized protein YeaO (DUF488 family)
MPVRIVRLGSPRQTAEGLRIGTVRRPPRGVHKEQYAASDYFDVWLPNLAPSAALMAVTKKGGFTEAKWVSFTRRYLAEMNRPDARRLIDLLAALSHSTHFSVGCYCEEESHCHRSLLRT